MITFKAIVISNNRRKDGTYPVKIRVTFKGVSRRLATSLVCSANDLTRSLRIKNPNILSKSDDLIKLMRRAVEDISPFDLENWDIDRVVSRIKDKLTTQSFRLDFFDWGTQYAMTKGIPTRNAYTSALNALERFLGKRELDINDITRSLLLDFMDYIDNEPKVAFIKSEGVFVLTDKKRIPRGASTRHIMKLQNIFNEAKRRYNDEDAERIVIPRSPFSSIRKTFPSPVNGQKNLGLELIQKIIKAETEDPEIRVALDAFIVSFGLMGANLADLYEAKKFTGRTWTYNRQKTRTRRADKAEMRVFVPDVLLPYIQRLQKGKSSWWLSVLHDFANTKDGVTVRINSKIRKWCESEGVPPFTFYAGRHSWATLARKAGVEKATIDECLCHKGDFDMADIYAERAWELMQDANERVLSLLLW